MLFIYFSLALRNNGTYVINVRGRKTAIRTNHGPRRISRLADKRKALIGVDTRTKINNVTSLLEQNLSVNLDFDQFDLSNRA